MQTILEKGRSKVYDEQVSLNERELKSLNTRMMAMNSL